VKTLTSIIFLLILFKIYCFPQKETLSTPNFRIGKELTKSVGGHGQLHKVAQARGEPESMMASIKYQ
jgi:hypothetical protein